MKTGKQLSKYYTYSIIWANKIIAEVEGYSVDKAYGISPVFGSMVEKQIEDYKKQLDRLRYTATVFGVFDQCKSMFDNFYETTKYDIDYLLNHDRKVEAEVDYGIHFQDYSKDEISREMLEALNFNKMWDNKMAYVMQQIGNISLEKTKWLPTQYANIFKQQHQIVSDLVENVGVYNQMRADYYYNTIVNEANSYLSDDIIAEQESSTTIFNKNLATYVMVQQDNITTYHNNMQLLDQIREDLLND